jgi:signal transduction histidine kinase
MQIKQRLRINIAVMAVSAMALTAVLWITGLEVSRALERKRIADDLMTTQLERMALRSDFIRTGSDRALLAQMQAKSQRIKEILDLAAEKFPDAEDRENIGQLTEAHQSIGVIFRTILANRQAVAVQNRGPALADEIEGRLINQLNMRVYEATILGRKLLDASSDDVTETLEKAGSGIVIIFLLATLITLINSAVTSRTVGSRIKHLRDGAVRFGQGELNRRINLKGRDEFTELSTAFDNMAMNLQKSQQELAHSNAQLEERVKERTAELEAANKELEAFSYSVSHDLRAPLRGIDGFSRIMLERHADKVDETGQDYLIRIRNGAVRMGRLIDDMLNLSRVGRIELRKQPVDLSGIARRTVDELRQRDPERMVQVDVAPDLIVQGDPGMLRMVMDNLLGNAWKFTGKSESARIEFGVQHQNGECTYYVKDNGAGFDMAYANKLFAPFHRLHKESDFAGTGIGLVIAQRVVSRHGGSIWAESELGKGATFYFTLAK